MAGSDDDVADTPKEALHQYILELERDYYPWYARASDRLKWSWGLGQATALLAGVLASVLAAAASKEAFSQFGWIRTALIVLPMIGALASSLLAQTRARELLGLRERGREAMQSLISRAKADYAAAAGDNARLASLHTDLIAEVSRLEQEQAADFFSIAPGGSQAPPKDGAPKRNG